MISESNLDPGDLHNIISVYKKVTDQGPKPLYISRKSASSGEEIK